MARNRTLTQLISDVRERAQLRGSQPTDAVLTGFINAAIAWVWQALSDTGWGYTYAEGTVVCTPNQATVNLPADFAAMIYVQRPTSGTAGAYRRAKMTPPQEYLFAYPDSTGEPSAPGVYWYTASALNLRPIPTVAEVISLIYEAAPPTLSDGSDTFDAIISADDPVIWYAGSLAAADRSVRDQMVGLATMSRDEQIRRLRPRDRGARPVRRYV